jgi:hypothetical protein
VNNNPLDVKEKDEHALDFILPMSRLFRAWRVWNFSIGRIVVSPNACLFTSTVSVYFSRDLHKI